MGVSLNLFHVYISLEEQMQCVLDGKTDNESVDVFGDNYNI